MGSWNSVKWGVGMALNGESEWRSVYREQATVWTTQESCLDNQQT